MSENIKNHFILNKNYPNTESILGRQQTSIQEVFKNALFVLDTNSLLVPYQTGKDDIEKIRNVYQKLIKENRLFIPKHVLREFAKNRSTKISELYSHIDSYLSNLTSIKSFEYPILGELQSYKKLIDSREEINNHIKKYKEYLKELKNGITNWNWSDPVTIMYSNTFTDIIMIDTSLEETKLTEEYNDRLLNNIPPGNKDKSKDSNAIGDFIIWKSILELGQVKQRDIIFISNDEKNDWLLKGNQNSISTKFELVDEYWRVTNGYNFICMTFSDFVDLQGIEIDITIEDYDINEFFFSNSNSTSSLDALANIERILNSFIISQEEEDRDIFINQDIDSEIKHYKDTYKDEFYNTDKWKIFCRHLSDFEDWLTRIMSHNTEIRYHEHRMKRDTVTEQILLIALSKAFLKEYDVFKGIVKHG